MNRVALLGNAGVTWRERVKSLAKSGLFLNLDPGNADFTHPGKVGLYRNGRVLFERFTGSTDPARTPHLLMWALGEALVRFPEEPMVALFPVYRPTPIAWQTTLAAMQMFRPDLIEVAHGTGVNLNAFPIGPTVVESEKAFPPMVCAAQRKAHWMALLERCQKHSINVFEVPIEGSRLGSGQRLDPEECKRVGLDDAYVEATGSSLFIVSQHEYEEAQISRALDLTHTSKPFFSHPDDYSGLVCSFVRQSGEEFGYGRISRIDFESGEAEIMNTAEVDAPVRILRLGSIRIDTKGNEYEEARPWSV